MQSDDAGHSKEAEPQQRNRGELYRRTVIISVVALVLVVVMQFQFGSHWSSLSTSIQITFPQGNFTVTDSRPNVTIADTASVLSEDFAEDGEAIPEQEVRDDHAEHASTEQTSPEDLQTTDEKQEVLDKSVPVQKVALMFLSVGELYNEPIWRAFFETADRLSFRFEPPDTSFVSFVEDRGKELFQKINKGGARSMQQAEAIQSIMACDREPDYISTEAHRLLSSTPFNLQIDNGHLFLDAAREMKTDLLSRQQLFSVYTHPSLGYKFPNTSLFYGTEVADRVDTSHSWASFKLIASEKRLMRAALKDEHNQKFVLLSESCVPLHRPELIYLQLLSEKKSRLRACHPWDKKVQLERWDGRMRTAFLSAANWRKSSQWVCLNRPHAELIARDVHVHEKFKTYCRGNSRHHCVPDEHYIPTTLAVYGVDDETDCKGTVTAAIWPTSGRAHPVSFTSKSINPILFKKLRHVRSCQVGTAQASTRHIFVDDDFHERCLLYNVSSTVRILAKDDEDWIVGSGYRPLDSGCPMFARKFAKGAVRATLRTALSCSGSALGYWC